MFQDGTLSSHYNFELEFPQERTVADCFLKKVAQHCENGRGERNWIINVETGESITFSQVEPLSRKVASSLFKKGMRHGDILLYSSHDITKLHVFFIGVWRANGTVRAIYPQEKEDVITEKIIETKARFYLCDPHTVTEVAAAIQKVPWPVEVIVYGKEENCTSTEEIFQDEGDACPAPEVDEHDIAAILSTSGTSGPSKGASYSHAQYLKSIVAYQKSFYIDDSCHPCLLLGRQTHISGASYPFVALLAGRTALLMKNFTKKNIVYAVHHYKPSLVVGIPKFVLDLADADAAVNYDLTSIKHVLVGGVVTTPSFISAIETLPGVRVGEAYGMTECCVFVSSMNCEASSTYQEASPIFTNVPDFSPGKLLPGTFMQVRDLDTDELLGPNQRGELYFKSPFAYTGYYNRPKGTDNGIANGWIRTGDVGYFDVNGFIYVVDRCKEIFKYFSNHISPSDLENIINRHEAVESVCVVGVPDPDGGDTIPRAFVTLNNQHSQTEALAEDIRKFANDNLPEYKQLRGGLIILPELPLGKSGKVGRDILSKLQVSCPQGNML